MLHCSVATEIWGFFLSICGIQCTMPGTVRAVLDCWEINFGKAGYGGIGKNVRIFEDAETNPVALIGTRQADSPQSSYKVLVGIPTSRLPD